MTGAWQNSSPVTLLVKWTWQRAVMVDPGLSAAAKVVAFLLADHLNCKTRRCDPSTATLAREAGLDTSTIKRARRELVAAGFVSVPENGGGRGRSIAYALNFEKGATSPPFSEAERGARSHRKGREIAPKRGAKLTPESEKESEKEFGNTRTHVRETAVATGSIPAQEGQVANAATSLGRPDQIEAIMPIAGGLNRNRLVSAVKCFHISTDNAELLVDGALEELTPSELRTIIASAKACNFGRDELQAEVGETIREKREAAGFTSPQKFRDNAALKVGVMDFDL